MRHPSLPQSATDGELTEWLHSNCIEKTNLVKKIDYTPEEISEFEHTIVNNYKAIQELNDLKDQFVDVLKSGTDVQHNDDGSVSYLPKDFQVPPTKGLKALEGNIDFNLAKIKKGHTEEITMLFLIPVPETKRIIAVDAEGKEYEENSRDMTADEVKNYNTLFSANAEDNTVAAVAHEPKKQKRVKSEEVDDLFGDLPSAVVEDDGAFQ